MLVGMRDSLKSCTKKGWERKTVLEAQMTDVWDAEYNCREKKRECRIRTNPTPPPPAPVQTRNHMEKIKCNYKSIITTEDEFIQSAFFTPAALASSFATDTKAHCDQKIQIHDK